MGDSPSTSSLARAATFGQGSRKSDLAYRELKKAILTAELPPGALLLEPELMEQFSVGRTPLREAIQRLEVEGLVNTAPRRGTFVSQFTSHDIRSVYELRCNLDAFAAELAAERASAEEIAQMEELLRRAREGELALEAADFDEVMHNLIVEAAHNPLVGDFHHRLYSLTLRVLSLRRFQRESLQEMIEEFTPIVEAIKQGNPEDAGQATLAHVMARGWFPDLDPYIPRRTKAEKE